MNILKLIVKREFIAKVRNKSFIVLTFLSPLLMLGFATFVGYLASMKPDQKTIAVHDESAFFTKDFKSSDTYKYIDFSTIPLKTLKDSVLAESFEGIISIPKAEDLQSLSTKITYISNDSPSLDFTSDVEQVIAKKITANNFQKIGIDTTTIAKAKANVDIKLQKANGENTVKGLNALKIGIGFGFGYLIMMFIIIYGNTVMRSVIEEKTNRIIEIIISSVQPFTLMMGKIIGNALAGLLQFAIWAIVGGALFFVLSAVFGVPLGATSQLQTQAMAGANPELMQMIQTYLNEILKLPLLTTLIGFVMYFIGGYFLYSSIYAAIGAAVDSETDSQQFMLPIILPLMLAVYVGFFSVLNDPHGTVAVVFSMIPFTSPIVMMMRMPFGVPWYQVLISLIILFATFTATVWFAAKIYRIGILMYGKKPTYKELYKWLKY
ncbi:MAG: putative ABC-type Na(+)-transporting system, permease component [Bacteroidota bacterium]